MKILDILFVVFELYNFVGLFKLRKSDKKEIKEQKATEHITTKPLPSSLPRRKSRKVRFWTAYRRVTR